MSLATSLFRPHPVTTFGFWKCNTPTGTFIIRPHHGRWIALREEQWLGTYRTPSDALTDLTEGQVLSARELPNDLSDWEFVRV